MIILNNSRHSHGVGSRTNKWACDALVQMNKDIHEKLESKEGNACSVPDE